MDKSSSKLLQVILQYPKNFLGWICKSSYNLWNCLFSRLWLTSGCTQNHFLLFALVLSRKAHTATDSPKSILHTLTDSEQNVRTLRFFHRPWAQPRKTRPLRLFHRCGKKPLVCASPYPFTAASSRSYSLLQHQSGLLPTVITHEWWPDVILSW